MVDILGFSIQSALRVMNLAVCLRVYPGLSKTPVLIGDKLSTFNRCFDSFLTGVERFDFIDLTVILDACPLDYKKCIIEKTGIYENITVTFDESFVSGNQGTFKRQLEVLTSKRGFDYLLFLEDDYLFVSNWFDAFKEQILAIDSVDFFLTGFRTSDYEDILFHRLFKSRIVESREISTTLTFFCTPGAVKISKKAFETFVTGNFDSVLWLMITESYYLARLGALLLLCFDRASLSRFYKGIRYFRWCKKLPLYVSSKSYMLHLDERGFPEAMRYIVKSEDSE